MIFKNNLSLIALSASFIIIASIPILFFTKNNPPPATVNDNPCIKSGCSGQLCVDKNINNIAITTCEWKEIYKCYKLATCEKQSNGKCGFSSNPEFVTCLQNNR